MSDRSQNSPRVLLDRLERLAFEARDGDVDALGRLRLFLQEHPELAGYLVDPVQENLGHSAHLLSQDDSVATEAIVADSVHWQKNLLDGKPCPVLKALAERLACLRLLVLYAEQKTRFQLQFDSDVRDLLEWYERLSRRYQRGLIQFARLSRASRSHDHGRAEAEEHESRRANTATELALAINGSEPDDWTF
ncbi:MAG: hypothetical protein K1X57_14160 [Gemmataceae bacterium]|nr:hypothetical protein [Gemmataceae bacterium]